MKTAKQINSAQCGESELRRIQERGERLRNLAESDAAMRGELGAWYVGKTGNHQGIVIDQSTGRNVAVTYQAADAPLVAAAPELLRALESLLNLVTAASLNQCQPISEAQAARAKAKGGA